MLRNKEEVIRRLQGKPASRAVRWYDPNVLVQAGIRDVLAAVFGEYADQRLMQAATDLVDKDGLKARYDYSDRAEKEWGKSIRIDEATQAYWVDYIADVGDGFGPTYGMARLLAQERLKVGAHELPAGKILILGGDQCYPMATREAYEERFVLPYASALPPTDTQDDERKVFALPGNHDWYDGLAAFDSLFCQSRDHLLGSQHGSRIGGWRCVQHRSYWAIHLPYDWWLWGVDIQFSKYLDAPQENYFRTMARVTEPGHNIVLCIAEPHWLDAEFAGVEAVDSLHTIVRIAQSRGAHVRAVLAGDWHHYNHYRLDDLYHPDAKRGEAAYAGLGIHLITAGGGGAFLHSTTDLKKSVEISWSTPKAATGEQDLDIPRRFKGIAKLQACYPSRLASAFLTLRNLAFPLRNWKFSGVLGVLYWFMTWHYHVVVKTSPGLQTLKQKINSADFRSINSLSNELLLNLPAVAAENIFYFLMLITLWGGLVWYVTPSAKRTPLFKLLARVVVGTVHALAHLKAMFALFVACIAFNRDFEILGGFYPAEVIPLGAVVGGFIFGAYWVLSGLLARMHTGDAFGALGMRDYKNFLRLKFEPDKLTIYPIGVKRLPSTKSFPIGTRYAEPKSGFSLLGIDPDLRPVLIGQYTPSLLSLLRRRKAVAEPIVILKGTSQGQGPM